MNYDDMSKEELIELVKSIGAGGVKGRLMPGVAHVSGADGLPDFPPNIAPTDDWDDVLEEVKAYGLACYKAALAQQDAETGKSVSVENQWVTQQEAKGMAECFDMVRQEMIDAGVIGRSVAPMFIADVVIGKLRRQEADAIRALNLVRMSSGWRYMSAETQEIVDSAINATKQTKD